MTVELANAIFSLIAGVLLLVLVLARGFSSCKRGTGRKNFYRDSVELEAMIVICFSFRLYLFWMTRMPSPSFLSLTLFRFSPDFGS